MVQEIRDAVLATIAYHGISDYPLTSMEVFRYLINPARLNPKITDFDASLSAVSLELERLVASGRLGCVNGFYAFSSDAERQYHLRSQKQELSAEKWGILMKKARHFSYVPYLSAVFISGSMSLDNSGSGADFDVLAVSKPGRLYTMRVFLSLVATLMRARRTRYEKFAPNKFCFNHYITENAMAMPARSLYTANIYAGLACIHDRSDIFGKFYTQNPWLNGYLFNFKPSLFSQRRHINSSRLSLAVVAMVEAVLNTFLGNWLESLLKYYQQRRIRLNPATYEPGGRVVFNDDRLEFHPHSFELKVMQKYNKAVRDGGVFMPKDEPDSGLIRSID